MLAEEYSGLELGPVSKQSCATGEVIELLDDDKNDVLGGNIRHDKEIRVKQEPQWATITDENENGQDYDHMNETDKELPRRSGREQATAKGLKD
jgi:hypothetical protein